MLNPAKQTLFRRVFWLAATYNLLWGVVAIAFPRALFRWLDIPLGQPDTMAVQFWQCIGMFVMVFAIGYAYVAIDPDRYAPFALIGRSANSSVRSVSSGAGTPASCQAGWRGLTSRTI